MTTPETTRTLSPPGVQMTPISLPSSMVSLQGTIMLPESAPFLVLGFGPHIAMNSFSEKGGCIIQSRPSIEVLVSSGARNKVPWSCEPMKIFTHSFTARVSLPPYATVVGSSSGEECFPQGNMNKYELNDPIIRVIEFPDGSRYTGAKGFFYPVRYPNEGNVMCREIMSNIPEHPQSYLISAGFALKEDCRVFAVGEKVFSFTGPHFSIIFPGFRIEKFSPSLHTLKNPCYMHKIPEWVLDLEGTEIKGIDVHLRPIPYLVSLFCIVLLVIPGIVQAFGSQDRKWGDIVNAVIGTGSVLVGVVLVVFQKVFGEDILSNKALSGKFNIRNHFAARLFARQKVAEIAKVACDPRIPAGLIARYKNSAVRAERTGWLRVGQSINSIDMTKHGYCVLEDEGLVLDLIQARYHRCSISGSSADIIEFGQEQNANAERLEGIEVFEGE